MKHSKTSWLWLAVLWLVLWPVLVTAQGDPQLRQVQERLAAEGLDPGPADGTLGQRTRVALRQYQAAHGLRVTGLPDEATRKALGLGKRAGGKPAAAAAFIIPLEVEMTRRETQTRGEIKTVEGKPELLLVSFACDGCQVEVLETGMGGQQPLVWASGAVHIYKGASVPSSYKSGMLLSDSVVAGGQIMMRGSGGTAFTKNPLIGWYFESDPTAPLIFKVVQQRGYVHIGGKGMVRAPTGQIYQLSAAGMEKHGSAAEPSPWAGTRPVGALPSQAAADARDATALFHRWRSDDPTALHAVVLSVRPRTRSLTWTFTLPGPNPTFMSQGAIRGQGL